MSAERLLRVPEVAVLLRVEPARIYHLIRQGLLPVVRLGRSVRVHPDELDRWARRGGRQLADDSEREAAQRT